MDFLNDLNHNQRAAVECMDGPMLVIAGAGSGKTRVLTYKIAYLLAQGVPAYNILALTFTNKAAREMKNRINTLVGEERARYLWMGTFHSIFARILRQEAEVLGYTRDYTIYDTADSKSLIKSIVKEGIVIRNKHTNQEEHIELDSKVYKPEVLLGRISNAKNCMLSPEDYANNASIQGDDAYLGLEYAYIVYHKYQQRLRQANAMDFDDLLFNMNVLIAKYPNICTKYQERFQYILVDEYQDTNYAQYKIVTALALPQNNLCVVGDDAQSIYAFRGATITNILSFQKQYQEAKLFKLEQNYRSTQTIVNTANSLIKANKQQIHKEVFSEKEIGKKIPVLNFDSEVEEAEYVISTIQQKVRREGRDYDEFAILYRSKSLSRTLEKACFRNSIPHCIYGGLPFYQHKEIKDVLAYFRLISNVQDEESLKRIIKTFVEGVGETTIGKVLATAHQLNIPAFDIIQSPTQYDVAISKATQNKLVVFANMINEFRKQITNLNAYELAELVFEKNYILENAKKDKTEEGKEIVKNLKSLIQDIKEFVNEQCEEGNEFVPITDYLAEVALRTDQDTNNKEPKVSLMTVHAAKGLEFPFVFIVGLENNVFPSAHAETIKAKEEERRLFYVAITRAEEECTFTYVRNRFHIFEPLSSSTFLNDIDNQYLDRSKEKNTYSPFQKSFSEHSTWKRQFIPEEHYTHKPIVSERRTASTSLQQSVHSPQAGNLKKTTGRQLKGEKTELDCGFAVGSRVQHGTFGKGKVVRAYMENGNEKIEIQFDLYSGTKTLLLKFAKLQLV